MRKPLSLKIGVSGVRGVVGDTLTPQLITSFAAAFGTYCGGGRIVIGTDTRPSREMVTQAAVAGLLSVGCVPVELGVVPVPTVQLHTRTLGAAGGICVTASHNPREWNALKFFARDGVVLRPNQFEELIDIYHQADYPRVSAHEIAVPEIDDNAIGIHRDVVLRMLNVDLVRKRRFKVALDCCNGAAFASAPEFLRALGCEVVELSTDPEAPFPRDPEPVPEHLCDLRRLVRESGADLGFAVDADADRLALVSDRGDALGEDCTVALAIRHVLSQRPGPVAVNVSTSRMVDDVAAEFGCDVYRSMVGEVNVIEMMLACGAEIGGEGTGGVIVPTINSCRDSFVAMGLVLESLAMEGVTLSELRGRMPSYAMVKEKVPCHARDIAPAMRLLKHLYRDEELVTVDGVKVCWADRWVHVRGSNTEPVMRVVAEAPTTAQAREMVRGVIEYLRPSG